MGLASGVWAQNDNSEGVTVDEVWVPLYKNTQEGFPKDVRQKLKLTLKAIGVEYRQSPSGLILVRDHEENTIRALLSRVYSR